MRFNTTFVTVLCIQSTSKIHVTDVSIQLLLLFYGLVKKFSQTQKGFNTTFVTVLFFTTLKNSRIAALFQYNFCYCSISHRNTKISDSSSFNTTFVTVLLLQKNTLKSKLESFNTTFVTVLYGRGRDLWRCEWFQYNFCYCSISSCSTGKSKSSVSIQLLLLFYKTALWYKDLFKEFQYNFCYCSIRIFTGFLFYYITRYPLKIKIF